MVKRLVGSGMVEPQAEAVVDLIKQAHDEVATREVLKYELALVEERIAARFTGVERRIDGVEGKVHSLGKDLTIRLGGMLAAAVALVGALVAIF